MAEHLEVCDSTFKTVKNKVCKFFVNGGCNKDDLSCKFLHPENKGTNEKVPACRNGPRCKYLISGVCAFFHRGVGVQTQNQQTQMYQSSFTRERFLAYFHFVFGGQGILDLLFSNLHSSLRIALTSYKVFFSNIHSDL